MPFFACVILLGAFCQVANGFGQLLLRRPPSSKTGDFLPASLRLPTRSDQPVRSWALGHLYSGFGKEDKSELDNSDVSSTTPLTEEQKVEAVGNLVENDEWLGLTLELSELIRTAVVEDIKSNARDFLGKDDYHVGDISKEIDSRVKTEVARLRGKEEYEVGDLVVVMDNAAKDLTSELTGKPYETGDLSKELDRRVKGAVARYCGKEEGEYEFGDLSKEIDLRVKTRVSEYLGKEYEFGDVSRAINKQRKAWVEDFLGKEAAEQYQFGDISKKAISNFTGKDNYEFGDVTKKLMSNIFKKNE